MIPIQVIETTAETAIIDLKNISKTYGRGDNAVLALNNVSLRVDKGEFVAILGPSGSGKTTLMNIIGLMDRADDGGRYYLDGIDITGTRERAYSGLRNTKIGFVFQKYNLIPQYTALYNVALPVMLQGKSYRAAKARARETLTRIGMADRVAHKPAELSGGQVQRVAIARALVSESSLILADEPTGALDQKTGHEVLDFMTELNGAGKTILIITHDPNIAARARRIIKMEDGRIIQ